MKEGDKILKYMYLEYISGPIFLSRLMAAKSASDLDSLFRHSVQDAIRTYGYEAKLWYENISSRYLRGLIRERSSGWAYKERSETFQDIFSYAEDRLFGERLSLNHEKFREFIDRALSRSASYKEVSDKLELFGPSGLKRAIAKVAQHHKWQSLTEQNEGTDISSVAAPARTEILLSETEGDRIVQQIRDLKGVVEGAELTQQNKTQASMLLDACLILSQLPSPNWSVVKELLYVVAAIATVLGVAAQVAGMIK